MLVFSFCFMGDLSAPHSIYCSYVAFFLRSVTDWPPIPPVVGADFFDNDNGGGGVFAEDVDEELGGSLDELGFLFRRRAVGSDLDVYEWHGCFNLSYIENILPGLG